MEEDIFDLDVQFRKFCKIVELNKGKISEEQQESIYMVFMAGAATMYDMLIIDAGNMPEREGMEAIKRISEQIEKIMDGQV